jgi:glycogen synthase
MPSFTDSEKGEMAPGEHILPLRILFWNQEYAPSLGGVEIYTQNLAKALIKRGHSVGVVTGHSREDLPQVSEIDGVSVYRVPFFQALSSRDPKKITEVQAKIVALKRAFKPHLVHVNFTDASPFFHLRTRKQHDVSLVVLHEASDRFVSGIHLIKALAFHSQSIIAPSRFIAEKFTKMTGGSEAKFQIIDNGVDEDYLTIPNIDDSLTPRLLFAGRLVPEKGVHLLIEAVSILARKGKPIRLTIAGAGPDLAVLKEMASQLEVIDAIDYVGWLHQAALGDAFAHATAVVVPSIGAEPFGLIAAEAAMAGRPVIASRIGALAEIIEDQETGLLFEPENSLDLVKTIERLIAAPDLGARLGAAARSRARERYPLSKMVDKYEHLYARLVNPD